MVVNITNTAACTKPTKISIKYIGELINDKNTGNKNGTIVKSTSPAKIFPNKRKENDNILAASKISSKIPTNNITGSLKLKYLPK